jgi:hypothetical protein
VAGRTRRTRCGALNRRFKTGGQPSARNCGGGHGVNAGSPASSKVPQAIDDSLVLLHRLIVALHDNEMSVSTSDNPASTSCDLALDHFTLTPAET